MNARAALVDAVGVPHDLHQLDALVHALGVCLAEGGQQGLDVLLILLPALRLVLPHLRGDGPFQLVVVALVDEGVQLVVGGVEAERFLGKDFFSNLLGHEAGLAGPFLYPQRILVHPARKIDSTILRQLSPPPRIPKS